MDRYFEPRDWVRTVDRHECQNVGLRQRPERHDSEIDAPPDLERLKMSMPAAISAWGLYLVMIAGLLVFSAMYPPQVYGIGATDLSDVIQYDGGADVSPSGSSVSQP